MESRACDRIIFDLLKNMHKEICLSSPSLHKPSLQKDWNKIFKRSLCEGLGFVTTTLPSLGRSVIESFKTRTLVVPTSFKKLKGTKIPMLYNGLFSRIYSADGDLMDQPDIECVRLVNQFCFMFYKYETGYSDSQLDAATRKYLETENELQNIFVQEGAELFIKAKSVINDILRGFNPDDIKPFASSGALATGEIGAEKFCAKRLYSEIHRVYPYYRYFVPTPNSIQDQVKTVGLVPGGYLEWWKGLQRLKSGTSKLCFVEKDSRGPRSISMEPAEYQFIQQGLRKALEAHIEKATNFGINFKSQEHNRELAIKGSAGAGYNTYDFSSASDRVSVEIVNYLFRDNPRVLNALHACRSTHTEMPDGSIVKLRKFAPMGSSICFPVMALVIYSIAKAMNGSLPVAVFGDDLILEDDSSYTNIVEVYKMFGLVVNDAKSFTRGEFRESCGADAFQGNIINPIRIKKDLKCKKPEHFAALVDSSNELYKAGYWHLAGCLRKYLQTFVSHSIPTLFVRKTAPGLNFCFVTDAIDNVRVTIDPLSGYPVYKRRVLSLKVPKTSSNIRDEFGYAIALLSGADSETNERPSTVVVRNSKAKSKLTWKWRPLSFSSVIEA